MILNFYFRKEIYIWQDHAVEVEVDLLVVVHLVVVVHQVEGLLVVAFQEVDQVVGLIVARVQEAIALEVEEQLFIIIITVEDMDILEHMGILQVDLYLL